MRYIRQDHGSFRVSKAQRSDVDALCNATGVIASLDIIEPDNLPDIEPEAPPIEPFVWQPMPSEAQQISRCTGHVQEILNGFPGFAVKTAETDVLSIYRPMKVVGTTDVAVFLKRYTKLHAMENALCICFELKKDAETVHCLGMTLSNVLAFRSSSNVTMVTLVTVVSMSAPR